MNYLFPVLLLFVLAPAFPECGGQGVTQPIIAVPAQAPAAVPPQLPAPSPIQAPIPGDVNAPAPAGMPIQAPAVGAASSAPGRVASPANLPQVAANYVIGPQDSLSISVWKEANVSGSVTVRTDGMISLPLVGDIRASEQTPTLLAAELTERLKKYINDPLVTVTVLAINSKKIFLTGEIGHPGEMPYDPNITPLQALIQAGGPSAFANKKHIYILRTVNGRQTKIVFDYKKAVKTGDQQGVKLLPGDTIVVP